MNETKPRIVYLALTGVAALSLLLFFSGKQSVWILLPVSAIALMAFLLLARTAQVQFYTARQLNMQLETMIKNKDFRLLFIPVPGCPEINAIGHRLNILIYSLAETMNKGCPVHPANNENAEHLRTHDSKEA
ncbi:MAG: hypothetical protein A2Z95_05940 [Gallionellales bacterium GWA2_60_18]|nr:MAG: hypothetical protein A2Z95_05940 [Gallionellales bacterium GWA2_60_18]